MHLQTILRHCKRLLLLYWFLHVLIDTTVDPPQFQWTVPLKILYYDTFQKEPAYGIVVSYVDRDLLYMGVGGGGGYRSSQNSVLSQYTC
jgi:hypothetical protein